VPASAGGSSSSPDVGSVEPNSAEPGQVDPAELDNQVANDNAVEPTQNERVARDLDNRINELSAHDDAAKLYEELESINPNAPDAQQRLAALEAKVSRLEDVMGIDHAEPSATGAEDPLQEGNLPERPEFHPYSGNGDVVTVGDSVTGPQAGDPTLDALVEHVQQAQAKFNEEGFTEAQQAAIEAADTPAARDRLRAMYYGDRIDGFVKNSIAGDMRLDHLGVSERMQPGPDFFDPTTDRWYDITTARSWPAHVAKYGGGAGSGAGTHIPSGR
jgi:hypothetical protein